MRSLKWKICGMRDPDNIALVAGLKPDLMGFIFYKKSPRYVTQWPPEGLELEEKTEVVGVFVNPDIQEIEERHDQKSFQWVQLHGNESPELCQIIKDKNIGVIKAFGVDDSFDFSQLKPYLETVDLFLFDTKSPHHGGTGKKFDWMLLKQYSYKKPFLISGGIGPGDQEALETLFDSDLPVYGIDINSRFESSPGIKNTHLIQSFIESVKSVNYES